MTEDEDIVGGAERRAKQFGEEIIEPGEPFSGETLSTIRALVAEDDTAKPPQRARAPMVRDRSGTDVAGPVPGREHVQPDLQRTADDWISPEATRAELEARRSWRRLTLVEGLPGRVVRQIATSPRRLSVLFLAGVVVWKPWFIPMLALSAFVLVLLVGVIVGQDRMFRLLLWFIQRFIWANQARGEALQRFLPRRWHWLLYKPINEEDAWEGPVDPTFEARLARLAR